MTLSCQDEKKGIEAVRQGLMKFENSFNAGDLGNLMNLYFDDVKFMQHGVETIVGIDGLEQQFAGMLERSSNVSLAVQEIDACGDMAYAHILTTVTLKPGDGGSSQKIVLRVLEVWRLHADGSWKISRIAANNPPDAV